LSKPKLTKSFRAKEEEEDMPIASLISASLSRLIFGKEFKLFSI